MKITQIVLMLILTLTYSTISAQDSGYNAGGRYYILFTKTCDSINIKSQKYLLETDTIDKNENLLDDCSNVNDLKSLLDDYGKNLEIVNEIEKEKKSLSNELTPINYHNKIDSLVNFCDSVFSEWRIGEELDSLNRIVDAIAKWSREEYVDLINPDKEKYKLTFYINDYRNIIIILIPILVILILYLILINRIKNNISFKALLILENILLKEETNPNNKNKIVDFFTQNLDDRLQIRHFILTKCVLFFWKYKHRHIKTHFVNQIREEIEKELSGNNIKEASFKQKVVHIHKENIEDKLKKVVYILKSNNDSVDLKRTIKYSQDEINNKIYNLTLDVNKNLITAEKAEYELRSFIKVRTNSIKERIYRDDYSTKIDENIAKIQSEIIQDYRESLDIKNIDEIIDEEFKGIIGHIFFEALYIEESDFNSFFIEKKRNIKGKIEEFISKKNTYYLPFPGEGYFWDTKKSKKFNDQSAYILEIDPVQPDTGVFTFVEKKERRTNAIKNFSRYLATVCIFLSSPTKAKDFIIKEPGHVIKKGGKWIVPEDGKMKIEFTY